MSVFKSSGIILKIDASKEKDFLLNVFTLDYGKLKLKTKKSKKEKSLDVGYVINFEIKVKKENSIHEIQSIKIKNEFEYLDKKYEVIVKYLELIHIINSQVPQKIAIPEIFHILEYINTYKNISEEKILFTTVKILFIIGKINPQHPNQAIQKILSFIQKESIETILKLKGLDEEDKKILSKLANIE